MAVHRIQRDAVGAEELEQEEAAGDHHDENRRQVNRDEHADEHDVHQPEQEHDKDHAGRQTAVCGKTGSGHKTDADQPGMSPSSPSSARTSSRVESAPGKTNSDGPRWSSGTGSPTSRTRASSSARMRRNAVSSPLSTAASSSLSRPFSASTVWSAISN